METNDTLLLLIVFLGAVALALVAGALFGRDEALRARLDLVASRGGPASGRLSVLAGWVARVGGPVARLATPGDAEAATALRRRLMTAGLRQPQAPTVYLASRAGLALGLPLAGFGLMSLSAVPPENLRLAFWLLVLATAGYYLPKLVLDRLIQQRQRELFEAFPDALDLMIICVEAGLTIDAAVTRAGEEMRLRSHALHDELNLVTLELRVGATRERALHNLALRVGLDEFASFVTMLLQTDRFGTSLAEALRVHADTLRTRRRSRAEEAAAKIPLKLLFPLIFSIFPSLFLVLMGPAMLQMMRVVLPVMRGG